MNTVSPYMTLSMPTKFESDVSKKTTKEILDYNLKTENINNLFPNGTIEKCQNEIKPGFLTSTRTRESKSAIESGAIDFNRWQYFVDDKNTPWGTIPVFKN